MFSNLKCQAFQKSAVEFHYEIHTKLWQFLYQESLMLGLNCFSFIISIHCFCIKRPLEWFKSGLKVHVWKWSKIPLLDSDRDVIDLEVLVNLMSVNCLEIVFLA